MSKLSTTKEVYLAAVRDALSGTPNASHPVQFVDAGLPVFVSCTLCGAAVVDTEGWRDLHRSNHDLHNAVHANIEDQANRYVSPPRYG